ncbi:ATPase, partial [Candidatus Roizmanbacteria bacterium CG22_combo_CG10-13_8_21_14_all_33_16]
MIGLTSIQVSELLKQYGLNSIKEEKKKLLVIKFIEQFNNFLTILLFIAAGLSFLIGEKIDGGLILAIVILNGIFGVYQEFQAEESLAVLKKITVTKVRVIRDGKEQEIDSIYLVPGDLVKIEEGTKISADGKLLEVVNLEINESILTGESLAITKRIKDDLFSGTIVSRGRGIYQVTLIGMQTRFGKI